MSYGLPLAKQTIELIKYWRQSHLRSRGLEAEPVPIRCLHFICLAKHAKKCIQVDLILSTPEDGYYWFVVMSEMISLWRTTKRSADPPTMRTDPTGGPWTSFCEFRIKSATSLSIGEMKKRIFF